MKKWTNKMDFIGSANIADTNSFMQYLTRHIDKATHTKLLTLSSNVSVGVGATVTIFKNVIVPAGMKYARITANVEWSEDTSLKTLMLYVNSAGKGFCAQGRAKYINGGGLIEVKDSDVISLRASHGYSSALNIVRGARTFMTVEFY